jgi:hypothetical protein
MISESLPGTLEVPRKSQIRESVGPVQINAMPTAPARAPAMISKVGHLGLKNVTGAATEAADQRDTQQNNKPTTLSSDIAAPCAKEQEIRRVRGKKKKKRRRRRGGAVVSFPRFSPLRRSCEKTPRSPPGRFRGILFPRVHQSRTSASFCVPRGSRGRRERRRRRPEEHVGSKIRASPLRADERDGSP